ncbi:transcriptional regulator NrdR [Candidatus Falkowbacteria bacterium RIFOXYB2_FULL_34_18]|uniref:Transcriptional repressor NrdR n=1 Tax=Candidatus Falkowbacteria bacterium RIFOXYD2_FULL_34_120 TaxID=1798007 RepID=A0A1F5TRN8_9BACT|nr:MAG: transcriptional regulator NrdR [Candidatus Falkowbacteria bacterium RIFOXYB2_FULL_34_18]OGF29951.1 MAG: transcriptional regulator NrdR [Candidatus Falkowbacteria bacterium RIFOXYC12_FULL_34_55]OGF37191.1 MAG: transcriptional regulator NrdR [Candidatus Falkowbacteria bacterium RIFOXYC2_FULL_34_220]OGF39489.1 MAG: transcriptional regulator NrdR [Candidatus Falkowbacteria bacterium RIFOXYD12_FULL_34_57]OGF41529.1 MAG: transcriptional regulator NrdR [Candidatus Falkowbacteria bacterium RIFO
MKCPVCYYQDTKVIDSRVASDGLSIRRRRECLKCGFRFSTYESIEILDLTVVKRDGSKELYNRDKLIRGLKRSLEKRPITEDKFKKLIGSIERDLQVLRKAEVTSSRVGQIIMKHLRKIDQIAYIRFASVYQAFDNIETFRKELDKLVSKKKRNNK